MNKIIINGILKKEDRKYNENQVYSLDVERKSKTVDTLLVLSPNEDLPEGPVHMEGHLHAEYIYGVGVPITIIPEIVESNEADGYSRAEIIGTLKDDPKCRHIKSGLAIATVILNTEDGPIPVLLWGGNATRAEKKCKKGDFIRVAGRLQSREYPDKQKNMHTTYELSAHEISYNIV